MKLEDAQDDAAETCAARDRRRKALAFSPFSAWMELVGVESRGTRYYTYLGSWKRIG
jgi:hypothetical protein